MMYRKIRFPLSEELYNQLKLVSITEGIPMTHIIRGACESYIKGLEMGKVDSDTVNAVIQANIQEKEALKADLKLWNIERNDLHITKLKTFHEDDWLGPVERDNNIRKAKNLDKKIDDGAKRLDKSGMK